MLILHGAIQQERFILWAESSQLADARQACIVTEHEELASDFVETCDSEQQVAAEQKLLLGAAQDDIAETEAELSDQRRQYELAMRRLDPELLAFAASAEQLRHALSEAEIVPVASLDQQQSQALISIPESDGIPLASSPMIGRSIEDADPASLRLAPWMVPGIYLGSPELIDVLCHCLDAEQLAQGLIAGQDLRFWASAMRFAGTLVARQQFLPGLRISRQGAFASWDPVFLGEDGEWLSQLAKGMPGSCLAGEVDSFDDTYGKRAFEILATFINQVADHLVRGSLSGMLPPHVEPLVERAEDTQAQYIHQRWIEAVVGANPRLEGSPQELAKLSAQIAEWRRPISVASEAPYRLCLRLEEPPPECASPDPRECEDQLDMEVGGSNLPEAATSSESPWHVRFLLQSLRDPGIMVPVDTVLSPSFEDLPLLRGGRVSAREYLFRSLGQAVRLCPDIEQSFADAVPRGFKLDLLGAHEFLSRTAPALKNAGFSVQLPGWWTHKQKFKAKAKVFTSANEGTLFGLKDLAEFDWHLALGGIPVSVDELE